MSNKLTCELMFQLGLKCHSNSLIIIFGQSTDYCSSKASTIPVNYGMYGQENISPNN
jgi:hypothetical protein